MASTSPSLEQLLAHGPWVRELARQLVRDPARADDLAQEAWVAALERPPPRAHALRRWFAAVLRNLARADRRAGDRRAARERFAGERGPEAPIDELCATLELSKLLADAVGGLEEPYRSAIFRRYYEGLEPRRIAELERLPLKTVKTRLARGLEKLRERLDREHRGERGAWVAVCIPALRGSSVPLALGGIVMNVKLACALAGLVLVGAWVVMRPSAPDLPGKPLEIAAPSTAPAAPLDSGAAPSQAPSAREREALAEKTPAQAAAAAAAVEGELPGRVIDPSGLGVSEVRLYCATPAQARAARRAGADSSAFATCSTSGPDGRFTVQRRDQIGVLLGERPGFVTLLAAEIWSGRPQQELILVVAPSVDVAGTVVDEAGRPVAGAELRIDGGSRVRRDLGHASDTAVEIPWETRSDEQGRFAFEAVPGVASAQLRAFHPRYSAALLPMPEIPRSDLRLVLAAREATVVAGEVVEANGQPVAEALVGMGQMTTRSDAEGRFQLELRQEFVSEGGGSFRPTQAQFLRAIKPGRLPARLEEPPTGWPGFVTLVIGAEPLSIRGTVLDAQGKALAGIDVRATNEHHFGIVPSRVGNTAWARSCESLMRGGDDVEGAVRTNREGEFELRGLLDEEYVLLAFDTQSLRLVSSEPIRAGRRGLELRFPTTAGVEHVAGRVLSMRGDPLEGVSVVPGRPGVGGRAGAENTPVFGASRTTDAQGRFDFGEIAIEGLEFQVSGEGLQAVVDWKPPAGARLAELELRAARRCHLQVDLGDRKDLADTLVVLDEQGAELEQWIHLGNMAMFGKSQPIRDGRSDVVAVPETAATVVLKKAGVEVQRRSLVPKPGQLETLRF